MHGLEYPGDSDDVAVRCPSGNLAGEVKLSLYELGEHFFRVDGDEDAFAAGQHFPALVHDLRHVDVGLAADFDFVSFDEEGFVQGHGLEIFDGHLAGEGDDMVQFVYLAHGVVENGGDDAAVAMAGRSGVAFAETEAAESDAAFFVQRELQAHTVGISGPAGKTVILLQLGVAGFVSMKGLARHGKDSNLWTVHAAADK